MIAREAGRRFIPVLSGMAAVKDFNFGKGRPL
jgi:hypothetical protein